MFGRDDQSDREFSEAAAHRGLRSRLRKALGLDKRDPIRLGKDRPESKPADLTVDQMAEMLAAQEKEAVQPAEGYSSPNSNPAGRTAEGGSAGAVEPPPVVEQGKADPSKPPDPAVPAWVLDNRKREARRFVASGLLSQADYDKEYGAPTAVGTGPEDVKTKQTGVEQGKADPTKPPDPAVPAWVLENRKREARRFVASGLLSQADYDKEYGAPTAVGTGPEDVKTKQTGYGSRVTVIPAGPKLADDPEIGGGGSVSRFGFKVTVTDSGIVVADGARRVIAKTKLENVAEHAHPYVNGQAGLVHMIRFYPQFDEDGNQVAAGYWSPGSGTLFSASPSEPDPLIGILVRIADVFEDGTVEQHQFGDVSVLDVKVCL